MTQISSELCIGCGLCSNVCSQSAISMAGGRLKVNHSKCNQCGHCLAICPKKAVSFEVETSQDVAEYHQESFTIDSDVLLNVMKFRRSIRQFQSRVVPEDLILKIIESGRFSPTATNLQDVTFSVVRTALDKVKSMAFETLYQMGKEMRLQPSPLQTPITQKYSELFIHMQNHYLEDPVNHDLLLHNAPVMIVVKASKDWAINGALAAANMELMTHTLGLGTFYCGLLVKAAEQNPQLMEALGVSESEGLVACLPIGYPYVKYLRTVPRAAATIHWI